MPAIKIPFRLRPADLSFGESFQARFQARVDRPIDDLDLDEMFRDLQDNLRTGDWVTVVAYRDKTWQQVMEWRTAIVTSVRQEVAGGKRMIRAAWANDYGQVSPENRQVRPVNTPPVKLNVKKEFGGGFTVQDDKGAVIERFKTKDEANLYIENLNRAPGEKAKEPKAA